MGKETKLFIQSIIGLILLGFAIFVFISIFNQCSEKLTSINNSYKSKVGAKVILNNDTLLIINYSLLNESFTLENGNEINISLLDKLETIENQ